MDTYTVITRKIEIVVNSTDVDEKKAAYNTLRTLSNDCVRMANFIVNQQHINHNIKDRIILYNEKYNNQLFNIEKELRLIDLEYRNTTSKDKAKRIQLKERRKEIYDERKNFYNELTELEKSFYEKSGTTSKGENAPVQNSTYQLLSKKFPHVPSTIRAALNQNIYTCYKNDLKDVLRGNRAVRTYKNCPIFFQKTSLTNFKYNEELKKEFTFTWSKIPFLMRFGRDRSNNAIMVHRVMTGEYILCDSSISNKDNKWFLNLVIKVPIQLNLNLSPEVSVGVDMGIQVPVFVVSSNHEWGKEIGNKKSFFDKKKSIYNQKRKLQESLSLKRGGHGYATKMSKLTLLNEAENNYTTTLCHTYAKSVIDYAKLQGAGVIKMEMLKGINKDDSKNKVLLRFWPVRKLQTLIEQKALRDNITVLYVDPYLTSQTCSKCGHYEENQREERNWFICKNPTCKLFDKKQHADRNAARNICLSNKYVISDNDCTVNKLNNKKVEEIVDSN